MHNFQIQKDGYTFNCEFLSLQYNVINRLEFKTEGANPLSETGYKSHHFGFQTPYTNDEAEKYAKDYLEYFSKEKVWQDFLEGAKQPDLFG